VLVFLRESRGSGSANDDNDGDGGGGAGGSGGGGGGGGGVERPGLAVLRHVRHRTLGPLLVMRFVHGFTFTMMVETAFGFYNRELLRVDARTSMYLLCYVGLMYSLVQARMSAFTKRFSDLALARFGLYATAAALVLWCFTRTLPMALLSYGAYAVAAGILNTCLYSLISSAVARDSIGSALGLSASVGSLTRVTAPTISGVAIDALGSATVIPIMGAALMFAIAPLLSRARAVKAFDVGGKKRDDDDADGRRTQHL